MTGKYCCDDKNDIIINHQPNDNFNYFCIYTIFQLHTNLNILPNCEVLIRFHFLNLVLYKFSLSYLSYFICFWLSYIHLPIDGVTNFCCYQRSYSKYQISNKMCYETVKHERNSICLYLIKYMFFQIFNIYTYWYC